MNEWISGFRVGQPEADIVSAVDADESVVYPDEQFYAEDFKKRGKAN